MNGNALALTPSTILNEVGDRSQQMLPRERWIRGPPCKHKRRNAWVVKEIPKRMTVLSQKEKVCGSEVHCEITTNHTNSEQILLNLFILLII